MLDQLPEEIWSDPNKTFFDPCAGKGNFPIMLVERLMAGLDQVIPDEQARFDHIITKQIFMAELQEESCKFIREIFPKANLVEGDSLNINKNNSRQFDVVIGNPPYQSKSKAKRWVIWHKFIELAVSMSKQYYCYVIPNSWIGPGAIHDVIMADLKYASLDVKKHFDVGSTFSYIICDKEYQGNPTIDQLQINKHNKFLPNDLRYLTINDKFFNGPRFNFIRTNEHHTTHVREWNNINGTYKIFHSPAQTYYSNKQPLRYDYTKHKAFYCMSGYTKCVIENNVGFGQMIAWLELNDNEVEGAKTVFNSKLYQVMLNQNKWSGWNSLDVIKRLPKVDLTKQWTDNDLYKHFNLTQQEIKLIENG